VFHCLVFLFNNRINQLHGAEFFETLIQEPATGPYPESDELSPQQNNLFP